MALILITFKVNVLGQSLKAYGMYFEKKIFLNESKILYFFKFLEIIQGALKTSAESCVQRSLGY